MKPLERNVGRLAALADDLRRRMYLFVRHQTRPVSREEVAEAVGVSRKLAAFHLDRLASEGLLSFHYERPPGRSGPGAGRPAKVYEPSDAELELSVPERRYDLVGTMLVDTIRTAAPGDSPREHAAAVAHRTGEQVGQEAGEARHLGRPGPERTLAAAETVLDEHGFEPHRRNGEVWLGNCPFHALSRYAPDLVCNLNHAFVEGMVRGLGNDSVEVSLEPAPGRCCVVLREPPKATKASKAPKRPDRSGDPAAGATPEPGPSSSPGSVGDPPAASDHVHEFQAPTGPVGGGSSNGG
jgi:predicted ArsR family transcriptional regulator